MLNSERFIVCLNICYILAAWLSKGALLSSLNSENDERHCIKEVLSGLL